MKLTHACMTYYYSAFIGYPNAITLTFKTPFNLQAIL